MGICLEVKSMDLTSLHWKTSLFLLTMQHAELFSLFEAKEVKPN